MTRWISSIKRSSGPSHPGVCIQGDDLQNHNARPFILSRRGTPHEKRHLPSRWEHGSSNPTYQMISPRVHSTSYGYTYLVPGHTGTKDCTITAINRATYDVAQKRGGAIDIFCEDKNGIAPLTFWYIFYFSQPNITLIILTRNRACTTKFWSVTWNKRSRIYFFNGNSNFIGGRKAHARGLSTRLSSRRQYQTCANDREN